MVTTAWGNLLSKSPLTGLTGESLSVTMNTSNQIVPPQGSLLAYDKAGEICLLKWCEKATRTCFNSRYVNGLNDLKW
jgi:hypothetical protein